LINNVLGKKHDSNTI